MWSDVGTGRVPEVSNLVAATFIAALRIDLTDTVSPLAGPAVFLVATCSAGAVMTNHSQPMDKHPYELFGRLVRVGLSGLDTQTIVCNRVRYGTLVAVGVAIPHREACGHIGGHEEVARAAKGHESRQLNARVYKPWLTPCPN